MQKLSGSRAQPNHRRRDIFAEPELVGKYRALILSHTSDSPRAMPPVVEYIRRKQRTGEVAKMVDAGVAAEFLLGAYFSRAFHDNMFGDRPSAAADTKFLKTLIRLLLAEN